MTATGSAIWHTHMGDTDGCVMARTNERNERTQQTHATKTRRDHLTFLTARAGLWISHVSRFEVA